MCVESPVGSGALIHSICRGVDILIGRLSLAADLLVLDMEGYDVILGMDWLAGYRATVDCYERTIVFSILGQEMFLIAMPLPEGGSRSTCITSRRKPHRRWWFRWTLSQ